MGQPIPRPVLARGEIDTGAHPTAIDPWIVQRLGLRPAFSGTSQTAGGPLLVRLFNVSLSITDPQVAGAPMLLIPLLRVSELTASLPDTDVLIGLDVLLQVRFLLDGPARTLTLEF
jgi:hypothetical protein